LTDVGREATGGDGRRRSGEATGVREAADRGSVRREAADRGNVGRETAEMAKGGGV
jgi:hypothetical protein